MTRLSLVAIASSMMLGLVVATGVFLASDTATAETDDFSVNVADSCSLSSTGNNSHTATIYNGTYSGAEGSPYENGIGSTTISVLCSDNSGFAIYATGFTGETIDAENSSKLVGVNDSTATIVSGTATGPVGNNDISNWSMKLAAVSGDYAPIIVGSSSDDEAYDPGETPDNYSNYATVPNTYTKVAYRRSATGTGANASSSDLTTTYAAYISRTQLADTYTGKVKYVLVHPYNATAPEVPEPEPFVPPIAPPASCDTPVTGAIYMQDINSGNKSTILANMETEAAYYLIDNRDNEPYCVSKLQDGNIWMLDNLRLDLTNSTTLAALTPSNTNVDSASLTSLRSGNRSSGDQYATAGFSGSNWTSGYSYSEPMIAVSGNCNDTSYCANDPSSGQWTKDSTVTSYGAGSGKIGVYYNYCAASAGSYCYGNGTSYGSPSGNTTEDLCPAGWRMPTGGSSGEYQTLCTAIKGSSCGSSWGISGTNTNSLQYKLSTPLSGTFYDGSAGNQGNAGYFWSSTYYGSYAMYGLLVNSSDVYPQYGYYRYNGFSVRCLLDG